MDILNEIDNKVTRDESGLNLLEEIRAHLDKLEGEINEELEQESEEV